MASIHQLSSYSGYSESNPTIKDRPEIRGKTTTVLTAHYALWRGWTVTSSENNKVFAEFTQALTYDYQVFVAPHCDTMLAALCGMIFREIDMAARRTNYTGIMIDMARKGVAMATNRR